MMMKKNYQTSTLKIVKLRKPSILEGSPPADEPGGHARTSGDFESGE